MNEKQVKEICKQFIKENLKLKVKVCGDVGVEVSAFLGDEKITASYDYQLVFSKSSLKTGHKL